MRLTRELVARTMRRIEDPGPAPGLAYPDDADRAAIMRDLLAERPADGDLWVFAYGSLIWRPAFAADDQRTAVLRGWHRSFCLGWDKRFRGSPDWPGMMLALDVGGVCKGVVQRLPAGALEASLDKLLRREVVTKPSPFPPRWITAETANGPVRAITFAADRNSEAYAPGLGLEEVADVIAGAAGHWGSMAEYLHNTVAHLLALGINDRLLWRLQELVAERIEAGTPRHPVSHARGSTRLALLG